MNLFSKEEIALDHELGNLIDDIQLNVHAIAEDSTVTVVASIFPIASWPLRLQKSCCGYRKS